MRFYVQRKVPRILLSLLWVAMGIFWVDLMYNNHGWRRLGALLWIILPLVQVATLWSYWEVTKTVLTHRGLLGRRPAYRLADLVYVGDVRREGSLGRYLRKATEVQFSGGIPRYITVADRKGFRVALQRGESHDLQPTDAH